MGTAKLLDVDLAYVEKDARFDTKLNSQIKKLLQKASMLEGIDLSSFVIQAATQRAKEVVEQSEALSLNTQEYKKFLSIIDNPPKATDKLKELMKQKEFNER